MPRARALYVGMADREAYCLGVALREVPLVETREVSFYGTIAVYGTIARPQN